MSYGLSEEQNLIKQAAREFAQEYISPLVAEMEKKDEHPGELFLKMAEQDFLGLFIPPEYEGAGADYLSFMLITEELSRISGAVGSILVNHSARVLYALNRFGTEEQKQKYLPLLCKGEKLGAFAIVEPDAAPGCGPQKLTAARDGESYLLNGSKTYVANGGAADIYLVSAVSNIEAQAGEMSFFIVDAKSVGLKIGRKIEKMGLKGCQTAEINFENVKVEASDLLGEEGKGRVILEEVSAFSSIACGAQVVGIMQAALEDATQYSRQRIQFRRPIGNFPAIQTMLANMATNVYLARLAIYDAARLIDSGEPFNVEAAMIKLFVNQAGQNAGIDAVQIEGGYGYNQDMPVSRFFRDVKGVTIIDNSAELPAGIIAPNLPY